MERLRRDDHETTQIVKTQSEITSHLIHFITNPEDTANRKKLEELTDRLKGVGNACSLQKSECRNLQIAEHGISQHSHSRNQSNSNGDRIRQSIDLQVEFPSNDNVKGAVSSTPDLMAPNFCINATERIPSGMKVSGTLELGIETDSKMSEQMDIDDDGLRLQSPDFESIEISDCDSDDLYTERNENHSVPSWCDPPAKIKDLSFRNQSVNPTVHFGEYIDVSIDLEEAMGKHYGEYPRKKEAESSY